MADKNPLQENMGQPSEERAEQNKEQALDACKKEVQEWKERTLRISADFENFKKRLEKDQAVWQRMIQTDVFIKLLEIVDNFDRALAHETDAQQGHLAGFALIRKDLQKLLENFDVREITQTKEFDPFLHESIMTVSNPEYQSGNIVQVLQKGYTFKDQVLRPAKVSIAE